MLGAVARRAGHTVTGVDGVMIGYPKAVAQRVAGTEPDVVGINTSTMDRLACVATIREIRRAAPKTFLVAGGSHFSHSAEDALRSVSEIDAVVVGEGERTFLELLGQLPAPDGLGGIQGLVWRDPDGQIVRNEPRPLMTDIDNLPMPAWDLFPVKQYHVPSHGVGKLAEAEAEEVIAAGVMTTRGCPQNCVFCANSLNRKMRYMNPVLAVDQMEHLHKSFGVTFMNVYDDDFLTNPRHTAAVCEEMLRRNCQFTWWCGARPARLDAQLLELMRRAGCACISFGVETGTNEVLKKIRKNFTTEQVYEAMEVVGKIGFQKVNIFLILGLPGETAETMDRTIQFIASLKPLLGQSWQRTTLLGQLPLIYPGTEMAAMGRAEGCLPENFSWNRPYLDPNSYLPLVNHRYRSVPHFQNRDFPIQAICQHARKHYWHDLSSGRRHRYWLTPLRRIRVGIEKRLRPSLQ